MAQLIKNNYKCAQGVLYSVAKTGWDNYNGNIAIFTAYKAKYDAAMYTAAVAAIEAAKNLPDEETRGANSEQLLVTVHEMAPAVLDDFILLKGYIDSAYAEAYRKANYEAAGQNYFAKSQDNESISLLGAAMNNYIAANAATLAVDLVTATVNMPPTFAAAVAGHVTAFDDAYDLFKAAEDTTTAQQAKVTANNAVYKSLTDMFADAKKAKRNDEAWNQLFTFDVIKEMVDPKVAGLKVTVTNGGTNVHEPGVSVSIQKPGDAPIVVVTNAQGRAEFTQLSEGDYILLLTKNGFTNTAQQTVTVKKGTTSSLDVTILPLNVRTGFVGGGAVVNIPLNGLFVDGSTSIKLLMTDGDTVRFYFAASANGQPGASFEDVNAGIEVTVTAGALGYNGTNVFLNVKNLQSPGGNFRVVIG